MALEMALVPHARSDEIRGYESKGVPATADTVRGLAACIGGNVSDPTATAPTSVESARLRANFVMDARYDPTDAQVTADIAEMQGYITIIVGFIEPLISSRMSLPACQDAALLVERSTRLISADPGATLSDHRQFAQRLAGKVRLLAQRYEALERVFQ